MKKLPWFSILIIAIIFPLAACSTPEASREVPQSTAETQPSVVPTPTEPDFTDAKQAAAECLGEFYSPEDLIKITANDKKVEVNVQATFPMEEVQPDNWEEIRTNVESVSSALMEHVAEHEIPNAVIYLIDSNGTIFLTAFNGTISYDKYDVPEPTPTPTSVPSSTIVMVWISSSGNRYHRTSTCSNMTGAWQVTPEEAWAMGYTACKRCY